MANSRRKCRYCKAYKRVEQMRITPSAAFCDDEHALQYARAKAPVIRQRIESKRNKEHKQKTREFKQNDYSYQFDLTKKAAQKLANTLDRNLECVSCGCARTVQFCGGHFRTVGGHRELALDIRNIHGQCNRNCNMGLSGNIAGTKKTRGFRAGLLERYGQAFIDFLESFHPSKQYTSQDLIQLRKTYSAEIRRIENGQAPSRDWRKL